MRAFFVALWEKIEIYFWIGVGIMIGVLAVGTFIPAARPAITWIFETLRTVVEALFWFFSIPWGLV